MREMDDNHLSFLTCFNIYSYKKIKERRNLNYEKSKNEKKKCRGRTLGRPDTQKKQINCRGTLHRAQEK